MGASNSTFLESSDNFPEVFVPEGGLSKTSIEILNGLNSHDSPYALVHAGSLEIIYVTSAFEKYTGFISSQAKGRIPQELFKEVVAIDSNKLDIIEEALRNTISSCIPFVCFDIRSGAKVCFQLYCMPLFSPEGDISCILCDLEEVANEASCTDDLTISLAYRINQANCSMKEQAGSLTRFEPYVELCERDKLLVETLQERGEMFCITDPKMHDNPIVFASDEFIRTIGYNRFEINGINCRFLQGYDTSPEDVDVIRSAIKELKHTRVCLLNYRKDGTRFINQFNISPLHDIENKLAFFIGVQIQVEDAEIMPFPNSRQTLAEMLLEAEF